MVIQIHIIALDSQLASIRRDSAWKRVQRSDLRRHLRVLSRRNRHAALALMARVAHTVESLQLVDSLEELFTVLVVGLLDESVERVAFIHWWVILLVIFLVFLFFVFFVVLILDEHLLIHISPTVFLGSNVTILEVLQRVLTVIRWILDDGVLTTLDLKVIIDLSVDA